MFGLLKTDFFKVRLIFALAILSMAIVSYEIQLIHFFSIVQWHHFAYMVISIALLGFGASGTVISLFRKRLLQYKESLIPFFMICSGLFMTLSIKLSRSEIFIFDSYTLFVDHSQFLRLLATYFLFFLPFFFGAMAIGLIFVKKVSDIGLYYFSDLLGAGVGGLVAIFLFWRFSSQNIPSIIALLAVLSGVIVIRKKARLVLISFTLLSLSVIIYNLYKPFDLSSSQFKGLSYALNLPNAKIDHEIYSPYGLLQVVSSPVQRYAPGLSLTYMDTVPTSPAIFNNGNWYASIYPWSKKDTTHLLNYTTMSLPYSIGSQKSILLLQAGAGLEISHALTNGAEQITAIEPNAIVISLLEHEYATLTDSLFYHPKLKLHGISSRTFLNQTREKYDIIQLPLKGAFGGSVGLNALQEENILTTEAFTKMWSKLNSNGMISISCWIDMPPKISLKIATTIAETLEYFNIENPLEYIAVIRSWGTMTFVIKRKPLNNADIERVKYFCAQYNFDPVLLPGTTLDERLQYNDIEEENFYHNLECIFSSQREKIIHQYDFNIQPATDNRPYFFHFLRWEKISDIVRSIGQESMAFIELGSMIVVVTFIQVIILALIFIILPLFSLGLKGGNKIWIMVYFCCLGIGYMFLEIVFIKYFVLYLGHPIYSVAIVISIMLISSGLGSFYSSRFRYHKSALLRITGIIAGFILVYTFFTGSFLSDTAGMHITIKIGFTCLLIALPSFFMGMPFPIGLKIADNIRKSNVPWAWGINGCASVISTSLATILAVELGFMLLMFFASLAYTVAFLSVFFLVKESRN